MRTLKLIDQDGLYSNLALLLSDQCVHTIKVAVFQGTDQTIFKDRREFTGSLMQQMNEVYDFIDFRNQTRATIENYTGLMSGITRKSLSEKHCLICWFTVTILLVPALLSVFMRIGLSLYLSEG